MDRKHPDTSNNNNNDTTIQSDNKINNIKLNETSLIDQLNHMDSFEEANKPRNDNNDKDKRNNQSKDHDILEYDRSSKKSNDSADSKNSLCYDRVEKDIEQQFLSFQEEKNYKTAVDSISTDSKIIWNLLIYSAEISVVLLIEALRDDIIFAFIRKREIDITEAFSSLCLVFDIIKTALPFSFTQGYGFLASKAFSSGNFKQLGRDTNKIYLILGLSSIFFSLVFLLILPPIFSSFLENPQTASNLATMLRWLSLGVPFSFLKFGSMRYLNSINKGHIATISSLTGVLCQVGCLFIFINWLDLVNFGISMSINIGMMINFLLQHLYIVYFRPCPGSEIPFSEGLLTNMWKFIKQSFTVGAIVYLSIFSFDFISYLGLMLGDNDYTVVNYICILLMVIFMVSDAVTASSNILINYCIGTRKFKKAVKIFFYTLTINIAYILAMVIIVIELYINIMEYFTDNPALNYLADKEKLLFVIIMILTCFHSLLAETLSAIGGECVSLMTTFFVRLILSVILGGIFVKFLDMGIRGIMVGMLIGQALTIVLNIIYLYLYLRNDCELYINEVKALLTKEKEESRDQMEEEFREDRIRNMKGLEREVEQEGMEVIGKK